MIYDDNKTRRLNLLALFLSILGLILGLLGIFFR